MKNRDEMYMQQALVLADQAADCGEVPIGAVIVSPQSAVVGRGHNFVERYQCQVQHAEVRAIEQACGALSSWRLERCTLYVTLEPCMMCVSLCALSRLERIVYGAQSPLFGYHLDKEGVLALYTKQIKNITAGVLADQAGQLLKTFFEQKREGHCGR
jgi:tRNA(adenine34) deaminase